MDICEKYLEQINYLVNQVIPFNICRYHCFLPISLEDTQPPLVLIAMVNPDNIHACDVIRKFFAPQKINHKKLLISEGDYQKLLELYYGYLSKLEQNLKITKCFEDLDYTTTQKIQSRNRTIHLLTPQKYDLVLGTPHKKSINSAVLGGKEGILFRFIGQSFVSKISALHAAIKYEEIALDLLIKTLAEASGILVWVAYSLLKNISHSEARKALLQYKVRLKQEDLRGTDLAQLNLKGIDLQQADLSNTNLRGTIINEYTKMNPKWLLVWQIVNQGLKGHNLSKIDLSGAKLQGANIAEVNFSEGIFSGVNFNQANLTKVNLSQAHLSEVNFRETKLVDLDLSNAYLQEVDFHRANLSGVNFKETIFNQVNFSEAVLHNADMSYLDLSSFGVNLSRLDLRQSKFIRANLQGLDLDGANLSKANLSGANLSDTNLTNTNLNGAKFILSTYNRNTRFPESFNPQRAGAVFSETTYG